MKTKDIFLWGLAAYGVYMLTKQVANTNVASTLNLGPASSSIPSKLSGSRVRSGAYQMQQTISMIA